MQLLRSILPLNSLNIYFEFSLVIAVFMLNYFYLSILKEFFLRVYTYENFFFLQSMVTML